MHPQTKEYSGFPATTRGIKRRASILPVVPWGSMALFYFNFWPPEFWDNKFWLCEANQFVKICPGSPRILYRNSKSYLQGKRYALEQKGNLFFSVLSPFNVGMGKYVNSQHCVAQKSITFVSILGYFTFSLQSKCNLLIDWQSHMFINQARKGCLKTYYIYMHIYVQIHITKFLLHCMWYIFQLYVDRYYIDQYRYRCRERYRYR